MHRNWSFKFYSKDVFCAGIDQGLLHIGEGLMSLNPVHSDRLLTVAPSLGALLILLHSCLDLKRTHNDNCFVILCYLINIFHVTFNF